MDYPTYYATDENSKACIAALRERIKALEAALRDLMISYPSEAKAQANAAALLKGTK